MPYHMKLPRLGAEMASARIVEWLKNDAEWVEEKEAILTVETDKVSIEIESPDSGYLLTLKQADDEAEIGEDIAVLCESEEEYNSLSGQPASEIIADRPAEPVRPDAAEDTRTAGPVVDRGSPPAISEKVLITPLAGKIAREHRLDIGLIKGSGPRGIIKKRDVLREIDKIPAAPQQTETGAPQPLEKERDRQVREIIPLKGMRKRIAQRLAQSIHQMAQFTDMGEIKVDSLVAYRKKLVSMQAELGCKISYNAILLKMVSLVLREFPIFNAALIDDNIHIWKNINIGFAVALDDGLIVPVIHDCDGKSIVRIQKDLDQLILKAKTNALKPEEVGNGTFTVSNFGSYGAVYGTPIINPPETALLGLGVLRQVPVIEEGEVVARWMMNYSLTMDHRVIDGALGGRMINRLRVLADAPELLSALW